MERIVALLQTMLLGETVTVNGVSVRRTTLLGFEVPGGRGLLDMREAARKIAGLAKTRAVRVAICSRCGGDGLGRRDRGACGLCHGPGIQVTEPLLGWREARPADITAATTQAYVALAEARHPRARASLTALLRMLEPGALQDSA
ncbi:hypothetical protein [Chondromyces apiculatus]|uniref:Uncharacterized protein n=1 Tax=Chondromyces apiculatus DSM 436 TaxID=1192034 RepID=A0A017SWX2_9BACT|nr:hypothetical protein [Chondromyces apiculatus]EYF01272.1 Hypothetical protein CAP_8426 [Chondromyces apiculatus DSM 436]